MSHDGCVLGSIGGEGDGEGNKTSHAACEDGGPPCVCHEEDLQKGGGMESHIVDSDSVDLVSSQGTCCADLCRQQCG